MTLYDLPHDELVAWRGSAVAPDDLDDFWTATLAESRAAGVTTTARPVQTGLSAVVSYDVVFSGFGGHPIRAWYHRPLRTSEPAAVVVRYQGYGGGRGLPHQVGLWPLAGHSCLEVDTRGQGSGFLVGDTADPVGSGPTSPGFLTRGIESPESYYYRRVFTDAVLAVDALAHLPGGDAGPVVVAGNSQGGGIAVAVAALRDDIAAALVNVPFLSDMRRGAEIGPQAPYSELRRYLSVHRDSVDQAFATLAYFDASVLATRATAPGLFSVALMDRTCPPSTVYATINAWAGPREVREYPFNDHEGGQSAHEAVQLRWLPGVLESADASN